MPARKTERSARLEAPPSTRRTTARGKAATTLPPSMVTGKASPAKAAVGDKPVLTYIASLPQSQRGIAERVDDLAARTSVDDIDEGQIAAWMTQVAAVPGVGVKRRRQDIHPEIRKYHERQEPGHRAVCELLATEIDRHLPGAEGRIWHAHPVWFLDGNPTVGYSRQKAGIRLMFWSGGDFDEPGLNVVGKKFKDASVFFDDVAEVGTTDLRRWLKKAQEIQWDYRNIVKRKGRLERLT